jgi:hypothetical protein
VELRVFIEGIVDAEREEVAIFFLDRYFFNGRERIHKNRNLKRFFLGIIIGEAKISVW